MPDQERERLRQLRERQIADRDPLVKQRKTQRDFSNKAKRMRKPFKLTSAGKDLPHIIRTPFYGLLLGIVVIVLLAMVWHSQFAFWVVAILTVPFIVSGLVLGNSLDLRNNIKDQPR